MVVASILPVDERLRLRFTYRVFYVYLSLSCTSCCLTSLINEMCVDLGVARIKTPSDFILAVSFELNFRQYMHAYPNPSPISYETDDKIKYDGVWLGTWLRWDKVTNGGPGMSVDYELSTEVKDVVIRNDADWNIEYRRLRLTPFAVVV